MFKLKCAYCGVAMPKLDPQYCQPCFESVVVPQFRKRAAAQKKLEAENK